MYNKNDDGLKQERKGRVWLDPPYSRPLMECSVKRMAEHGNGIALLFNRRDSKMFQDVIFEKATAMKFLRNRIRSFRPDGTRGDSPGCGGILIAFGENNAGILKNRDMAGKYVRSIRMTKKMNKEEFLSKRYAIGLRLKELDGEKEQLEKEYIESNQVFPVGSKVCITVPAHGRNNESILVPEAKKLAYIADYEIDDNGEVVPSLRQLDYNGGMSAIPLFVNLKKAIIELV